MDYSAGIVIAGLSLTIISCAPIEGLIRGEPLGRQQLAALHSTPTVASGSSPDGSTWTVWRFPGGSQLLEWSKGGITKRDQGHYEIRGDQVCSRWQNTANAAEECNRYFNAGEKYHSFSPNGWTLTGVFTVAPFTP